MSRQPNRQIGPYRKPKLPVTSACYTLIPHSATTTLR